MKKYIFFLILFSAVSAWGASITTVDELFAAAATDGSHTINVGTYDLSTKTGGGADLVITGDWVLTINGSGNVTIDGSDQHRVIVEDCTSTFSGTDASNRIIITQGDTSMVDILSTAAAVTATFNYCTFSETNSGNGLQVTANPAENVTVTCNYCIATNNEDDGFSILTGNTNSKIVILNLNNCDSYSNGTVDSDQGATAHSAGQYLNISGGNYYQNAGPGVAINGGSTCTVDGAVFYENGGIADVLNNASTVLYVNNCTFHSLNAGTYCDSSINSQAAGAFITNCIFRDGAGTYGHTIYNTSGLVYIENCIFKSVSKDVNQYCVYLHTNTTAAVIKNNTFYDYTRGITINGVPESLITNNIFHTASSWHIRADNKEYQYNPANGYNYLYNSSSTDFYPAGQIQSNDVTGVDPQLMDVANNNFKLKPASPCLNTGSSTPNSGKTSIGAWQPHAVAEIGYRSRYCYEDMYTN